MRAKDIETVRADQVDTGDAVILYSQAVEVVSQRADPLNPGCILIDFDSDDGPWTLLVSANADIDRVTF